MNFVSVVIPFYNAEKFLGESIESVIHQTYSHWELLLVDDGSTDSSTRIAHEYVTRKPEKIRYIEHEKHQNRGACASRNAGAAVAKGEYIAFLDSDDVWLPQKLEEQVKILNEYPEAAMVYGPALYWYSWAENVDEHLNLLQDPGVGGNRIYQPPELLLAVDPLGKGSSACPSNILIRKDALNRIGGFEEQFVDFRQLYEDQAFAMKISLKEKVFVSKECWMKYRRHPDSCLSRVRRSGKERDSHFYFLNWAEKLLEENGQKNTEAWIALQRAMWCYRNPTLSRLTNIALVPLNFVKWAGLSLLGPRIYYALRRKFRARFL
jgi:glycosyltransferase involved in cell wall biosynthesis